MLDTEVPPNTIANEIVSNLEFDHRTDIASVVVLTQNGKEVAVYDRKEKNSDDQNHSE